MDCPNIFGLSTHHASPISGLRRSESELVCKLITVGVICEDRSSLRSICVRNLLFALALLPVELVSAACPSTFVDNGAWFTSDPEWSDGVIYVITNFSVSNDTGDDIDFSSQTPADTLQTWVNLPLGGDPYSTPAYSITDGDLSFKMSPAGNVYAAGATVTWQVAMNISGAPVGYQNTASIRPEEGGNFGQFSYTLLSSNISCSSGEPFFATVSSAEAGVDEIILTVTAEEGSAAITSYDAECEDTGGHTTTASSSGSSITVGGLETGNDYTCTVTATNSIGTSAASAPSETLTPSTQGLPIWLLHEASTP